MPNYKAVKTTTTKIKVSSELEKMLKIDRFNFEKIEDDKEIKFNEELIKKKMLFMNANKPQALTTNLKRTILIKLKI